MTTFIQKALGLLVFVFRSNSLCTFFVKILVTWLVGQIKWQGFHKVRRYSILQASSLFGEYCENSATRTTQEGVQEWGVGGVEKAPLCSCATPWCVCLSCFTRYFGRGGGGGRAHPDFEIRRVPCKSIYFLPLTDLILPENGGGGGKQAPWASPLDLPLTACLHGSGGGPQVSEVACLGGVISLSIIISSTITPPIMYKTWSN